MEGNEFVLREVVDPCGDRDRTLFQESTGVLESGSWDMGREWGYDRAHL